MLLAFMAMFFSLLLCVSATLGASCSQYSITHNCNLQNNEYCSFGVCTQCSTGYTATYDSGGQSDNYIYCKDDSNSVDSFVATWIIIICVLIPLFCCFSIFLHMRYYGGGFYAAAPLFSSSSVARPIVAVPVVQPAYPQQGPVYPQQGPVYPQQGPVYPQQGPVYPQQGPAYPQQGPAYPQQGPVYPQQGPVYPANQAPYQGNVQMGYVGQNQQNTVPVYGEQHQQSPVYGNGYLPGPQ